MLNDMGEVIDAIVDNRSLDKLVAIIPELVRHENRLLPRILGCVIAKRLWHRWGFEGPWEYLRSLNLPQGVLQRVMAVILGAMSAPDAQGRTYGPAAREMITDLVAGHPEAMSSEEFLGRLLNIHVAADEHQRWGQVHRKNRGAGHLSL
jgi:hypothetical protein